jgi:hypothetical protein
MNCRKIKHILFYLPTQVTYEKTKYYFEDKHTLTFNMWGVQKIRVRAAYCGIFSDEKINLIMEIDSRKRGKNQDLINMGIKITEKCMYNSIIKMSLDLYDADGQMIYSGFRM